MRDLFIKNITNKATKNKNFFLVVGDLGFSVIEPFQKKFPKRFVNAGVSEQNMMGMAAGIASEGIHVFVYSIANFPTFRCAEQIRNDIDYHKFPVTIVSVGAGVSYGNLGYSHHALQDYGLMRLFPNVLILSPGNNKELTSVLDYIVNNPQPSYLRLDKTSVSIDNNIDQKLYPGKLNKILKLTSKNIILTTGNTQQLAINLQKTKYRNYSIYSIPMWGMKQKKIVRSQIKNFKQIITIEDHFKDCGFGSWIKECLELGDKIKIQNKYITEKIVSKVGSKKFLTQKFGPK